MCCIRMAQHTKCKNLDNEGHTVWVCFAVVVVNEYKLTIYKCTEYGYMSVVDSCPFSNTRIRVYRTSSQYFPKDTRIERKTAFFPSLEKQVDRKSSLQLVLYKVSY